MVKRIRFAALVIAAVGAVSTMVPAAVARPGTLTLTSPTRQQAVRGEVDVTWVWRSGTAVKSTSKVDLAVTQNGVTWYTIGAGLPIRSGEYTWDTGTWPDSIYAVRATVSRTTVKSVVSPMFVDNTAPQVRVTRPAEGEVLVENERMIFFAAVVGTARLEADASDALSGVDKVRWLLNDEEIGVGTPFDYNFSTKPGRHQLTAEATDKAGNTATHEITLIVAPGPSAAEGAPDPGDVPIPDPDELPDPGPLPTLPATPEVPPTPAVPEELEIPSPEPNSLPTAIPSP